MCALQDQLCLYACVRALTHQNTRVQYIAGRDMATIFSIEVSAVSKGAALSHLSQFPGEDEVRAECVLEPVCARRNVAIARVSGWRPR